MIRAGKYTIEDQGFTVETVNVGGTSRQVLIAELPSGITNTALEAFCAGPVEALDEAGNVVQTHTGPFTILSHGLKLVRENPESDVAVLTARVASLEAELLTERNEKVNAKSELASLSAQLSTLRVSMAANPTVAEPAVLGKEETDASVKADANSL